jgi:hypothetical protein
MALQRQAIPVPFSKGLDTKTDPKQVIQGKLLTLENGIFTSPGRLRKRNGYIALSKIIEDVGLTTIFEGSGLANFKNELLLLTGTECYSYSDSTSRWSDKHTLTNVQLSSSQIVRNTYNQTTPDVALDITGLEVVTYQDSRGGSRYTVIDVETGEQLVSDKLITLTAEKPKAFALGNFLVILYLDSGNLNMLPIPVVMPSVPLASISLALGVSGNYDASVYSDKLYIGFNKAGNIGLLFVNEFLSPSFTETIIGENASSCIAVYVDQSNGQVWTAYDNGTQIKYFIYDAALVTQIVPPTVISSNSNTILNIALSVTAGSGDVYYTQVGSIPSNNFILTDHLTNTGVVSGHKVFIRSVSIAGKLFTFNDITYITTSFDTVLQPTYFVLRTDDSSVVAKFSPSIGGGTPITNMVPEAASIEAGFYTLGALQKDLLTTISGVVYTQTGVNSVTLDFVNAKASKVELGANTHITSGILNIYDGVSIVEQGFNVFPENITAAYGPGAGGIAAGTYEYSVVYSWMDAQGQMEYSSPSVGLTNVVTSTPAAIYFTGTHLGPATDTITVNNPAGLAIGQVITDLTTPGNIPANTIITGIVGNILTLNNSISADFTNDELVIANPGLVTFQAVFGSGVNNFVAMPSTNLYIGMPLSDLTTPGNFPANTFITNITGSTITINNFTAGASAASPGDVIQGTTPGSTDFTSVFFTGQTTIPVNNTTNLFVGQTIMDITTSGNLTAGTKITAVNPIAGTITLNQPTAGNSAAAPGDTLQTADGFSVVLVIPTLRLTQKKPPIRTPVVIQVYRTAANQTEFFLISSVIVPLLNDTTVDTVTFVDTSNDASIIGNPILYTTGGVLDNDPAPAFSWVTTYQDRVIGLPEENKNQWWYSKQNIPGSPVEFSGFLVNNVDQAGGDLVSALKMDSELVFWKQTLIYYITGAGPDSTGAQNDFSAPQLIASDVGCSDKNSLVLTPAGVLFKSLKGIYLLDRKLGLTYIGAAVESYNQFDVIAANLIDDTQQVRFCLSNGQAIVYDYYVGEWSTFTNIPAVDAVIFQGLHTYLTLQGKVLQESPGKFTDDGEFIKLRLVTAWLSFVGLQAFQRVYHMLFLGDYFDPHNVAVYAAYDFNPFPVQQNVVQAGQILGTGVYGSDATYGETTPYGGPPQTYQFRVNLNRQKCETIQISIEDQQLGSSFGENLALSAFSFMVGVKSTLNKIVALGSNTPVA